jgi:hypothetical protein
MQGRCLSRLWIALCALLVGCSALGGEDLSATLQAQGTAYIAEATAISDRMAAMGTQIAATTAYAATYVAQVDGTNRQIVATLRASVPPTPQIVTAMNPELPIGTLTSDMMGMPEIAGAGGGILQFLQFTQTASSVRSSDGCAENVTSQFTPATSQIYATARALNVSAGTELGVEWLYEGQIVYSSRFVVEQFSPDYCFWFFITPQDVPFTPGNWSVRMLVNGAPTQPFSFTISG